MIRNLVAALGVAFVLSGCANIQKAVDVAGATVPAQQAIQAANGFNILKGAATRYAQYCIQQQMAPAICSAETRRIVIKTVRVGTGARNRMVADIGVDDPACRADISQCRPTSASVYNLVVGAIDDLKNSPVHSAQFGGIIQ
jgi:hypothetical protein